MSAPDTSGERPSITDEQRERLLQATRAAARDFDHDVIVIINVLRARAAEERAQALETHATRRVAFAIWAMCTCVAVAAVLWALGRLAARLGGAS